MKVKTLAVNFVFLINVGVSLRLPPGFKKCDKRKVYFNDCLTDAIQQGLKQLNRPYPEYGLSNLDPFLVPETVASENCTSGMRHVYKNLKLLGQSKPTNIFTRMDFEINTLTMEASYRELNLESDIQVFGNLIVLPINTTGFMFATLENPVITLTFILEEYEKGNNKYYKVVRTDFNLKTDKLTISFKDLFENTNFNNEYNAEVNANWRIVFQHLTKKYARAFGQIYGSLFNNLLKNVPITELFDGLDV